MNTIKSRLIKELHNIKNAGLYKNERIINSQQNTEISVNNKKVLNFCANNYLGLANNQTLIKAAKDGLDKWGFGLSSVRFICGTQDIHKILESNSRTEENPYVHLNVDQLLVLFSFFFNSFMYSSLPSLVKTPFS